MDSKHSRSMRHIAAKISLNLVVCIGIGGIVIVHLNDIDLEYLGLLTTGRKQMIERNAIVVDVLGIPAVFCLTVQIALVVEFVY